MSIAALIVAAGRGTRAGGEVPKQYARLAGRPVLTHSLEALLAEPRLDVLQVVIHSDDRDRYAAAVGLLPPDARSRLLPPAAGRASRQGSVRAGLEALAGTQPSQVLVHDAARPFVDRALLGRLLEALTTSEAAIAAVPLADTLKRADAAGRIAGTVDRTGLWRAQTPQAFRFEALLGLHQRAAEAGRDEFTDDAALAEWGGLPVTLVPGDERNRKLTSADDLAAADRELRLEDWHRLGDIRTGTGLDVHKFGPGDGVLLCGVRIAHDHGLVGHSDADVALHALTDAILGTLGDGDIGSHFPPSDPQWRGKDSAHFVRHALALLERRGGRLTHADVSIVCERPRIGPYREAMRARLAEILGCGIDRTAVKATTSEGLGFTGRREGILALATVTVRLPG